MFRQELVVHGSSEFEIEGLRFGRRADILLKKETSLNPEKKMP